MASKSFFEKIYIDREVVQEEASAADIFFIGRWMGKETNRSIFLSSALLVSSKSWWLILHI
ncbi:hypothetical protein FIN92_08895 [Prevotella brunnea]|nr:hypothetical protein [Prevotella brunnea]